MLEDLYAELSIEVDRNKKKLSLLFFYLSQ